MRALLLLLISAQASASVVPFNITLPGDDAVQGYKTTIWQVNDDGTTIEVIKDAMFYNRRYFFCLVPVLYGVDDDGNHLLDEQHTECHYITNQ